MRFDVVSFLVAFSCIFPFALRRQLVSANEKVLNKIGQETYGVDVSFPMQHLTVSTNYASLPHNANPKSFPTPDKYKGMPIQPLGNKQKFHDDYIQGCRDKYNEPKGNMCDIVEEETVAMNLRQPQSVKNYTEMGFSRIKAPDDVFKHLKDFWDKNKKYETPEPWARGNSGFNHWETPTTKVEIENKTLAGGGLELKQKVWKAAHTTLEQWTGQKLTSCFMFGIRVYHSGAVLATHVDRLPLVSSAIINVAQDVDEPWPLEVIGRDGYAYNATLEPGEMILYESHSTLHGRPFPLKGRFYANVFVHFEPLGEPLDGPPGESKHRELISDLLQKSEKSLPPYLIPGSAQEKFWKEKNPEGWKPALFGVVSDAKEAAYSGDVESLKEIIDSNYQELLKRDRNGWQAIHEASRGGHLNAVRLLAENGVDINSVGGSMTPLRIARETHGPGHPIVTYLLSQGATDNNSKMSKDAVADIDPKAAKDAAYLGDVDSLQKMVATHVGYMQWKDSNGWQLIHEASRAGHAKVIELLANSGADLNAVTNHGTTPLHIAKQKHGANHPVVEFLTRLGARDIGPEL